MPHARFNDSAKSRVQRHNRSKPGNVATPLSGLRGPASSSAIAWRVGVFRAVTGAKCKATKKPRQFAAGRVCDRIGTARRSRLRGAGQRQNSARICSGNFGQFATSSATSVPFCLRRRHFRVLRYPGQRLKARLRGAWADFARRRVPSARLKKPRQFAAGRVCSKRRGDAHGLTVPASAMIAARRCSGNFGQIAASRQKRCSPAGSAAAGVGCLSMWHNSQKCSLYAANSFNCAARHFSINAAKSFGRRRE